MDMAIIEEREQAAVGFERRMRPTVMIVEDEEALSTLLQYNLDKEGYKVVAAADGEEAAMLIREVTPDLVLLDWMLPGISGIELCRRLRMHKHRRPFLGGLRAFRFGKGRVEKIACRRGYQAERHRLGNVLNHRQMIGEGGHHRVVRADGRPVRCEVEAFVGMPEAIEKMSAFKR